jgi:hypothetical protein
MKRLSLAFYLFLVFASGLLVGGIGYRLYSTEATAKARTEERGGRHSAKEWRARFTKAMIERLTLDENQVRELNVILDRTKGRFDELEKELHNSSRPQRRAIIEKQIAEINAMLDQEQQAEYEKWLEERAAKRRKDGRKGPPPPRK